VQPGYIEGRAAPPDYFHAPGRSLRISISTCANLELPSERTRVASMSLLQRYSRNRSATAASLGCASLLHGAQFGVASRPGSLNFRSVNHNAAKATLYRPQPSIVATLPITTRCPGVFFQPFFDYRYR
jgi:hypothetical protein